jgi:hypothetical protein
MEDPFLFQYFSISTPANDRVGSGVLLIYSIGSGNVPCPALHGVGYRVFAEDAKCDMFWLRQYQIAT